MRIFEGGRCFDEPTTGMPVPRNFSMTDTQILMTYFCDGPTPLPTSNFQSSVKHVLHEYLE